MAVQIFGVLQKARPNGSIEDHLVEVDRRIAAMYPETRQAAPTAHAVEGGSRLPAGSTPRGKGWSDIPKDDRAFGERFIANDGLFLPKGVSAATATERDIAAARAAYAREYWGSQ
jgi:hypothetical protein